MLCNLCNENSVESMSCARCRNEWCIRCHLQIVKTGISSDWGKVYKCPYCRFIYVEKSKILQPLRVRTRSSACSIL